jgi:hypothetical protein
MEHKSAARHTPKKKVFLEWLDEPDRDRTKEEIRAAAPAARKQACPRGLVIRAGLEFAARFPPK